MRVNGNLSSLNTTTELGNAVRTSCTLPTLAIICFNVATVRSVLSLPLLVSNPISIVCSMVTEEPLARITVALISVLPISIPTIP